MTNEGEMRKSLNLLETNWRAFADKALGIEEENKEVHDELDSIRTKVRELEEDLYQERERSHKLVLTNESLNKSNEEEREKVNELQGEKDKLEELNKNLMVEVETLKKTNMENEKRNEILVRETAENGRLQEEVSQTKRENGGLKKNIEKMNTDIEMMRKKVQSGEDTHAKEKVEFQRQMREVECELSSERSTNLGLSKALEIHSDVSSRREKLNADVDETEEVARQAKRSRDDFEKGSAKEIRRVDVAVGFLERGELDCGKKLINEIEASIASDRKKWKSDKRNRTRVGKSKVRKEEGEVADGSLLMVEDGGEGGEAHRDQMELSTT